MAAMMLLTFALGVPAQTVGIDFNPMRDGFRFENYRNEGDRWKDDLGADDLMRMFGSRTSCDALEGRNCKTLRAAAAQWRDEMLEAMNIGRCEGMAVACLRMRDGLPFKGGGTAAAFQPGAGNTYALRRSDRLENYIAYFWVTQTFDEVKRLTEATAAAGPVKIVQTLQAAFRDDTDSYVLRFAKFDPKTNEIKEPHAIVPFGVEELPDRFVLKVYDNRYPGQTR